MLPDAILVKLQVLLISMETSVINQPANNRREEREKSLLTSLHYETTVCNTVRQCRLRGSMARDPK
jgi:hypothetical protein